MWPLARTSAVYTPVSAVITDTSDIMNGNVTVNLTAPSGTTGGLNLDFNGSNAAGPETSQATFAALVPGSRELQLAFDAISPGIYPMANGTWNALLPGASSPQTVTVPNYTLPTPWTYFRKIFYTQYNVPHESACPGGDLDAWLVSASVVKGKTVWDFTPIRLNSDFIAAVWINGTGIDNDGDFLKSAAALKLGDAQRCAGQYPARAVGHTPQRVLSNGNTVNGNGNTLAIVSPPDQGQLQQNACSRSIARRAVVRLIRR
jgi:hypothetical protein